MLAQGGSLQVTNCVPKNCDTACHWRGCYTRQHYPSINQLRTLGILQLTTLSTTPWPLASQLCQNSPQLYSLIQNVVVTKLLNVLFVVSARIFGASSDRSIQTPMVEESLYFMACSWECHPS